MRRVALLVLVALVVLSAACTYDFTIGDGAVPDGGPQPAAMSCPVTTSSCAFTCDKNTSCSTGCLGGKCATTCGAGAHCDVSCIGGNCATTCESGSVCNVECLGGGCTTTCNGGTCKTTSCSNCVCNGPGCS